MPTPQIEKAVIKNVITMLPYMMNSKIAEVSGISDTTVSKIRACVSVLEQGDADTAAKLLADKSTRALFSNVSTVIGVDIPTAPAEQELSEMEAKMLADADKNDIAAIIDCLERIARSTSYIANFIYKTMEVKNNA